MTTVLDSPDIPSLGNPHIFQLEIKPKHVLSHEIGAGAPCTKCDCPGLDLHFWRKRCKNCACRLDDHDVVLPTDHGQIVIGRLFGAAEIFERLPAFATSGTAAATASDAHYAVPAKHGRQPFAGNEGRAAADDARPLEAKISRAPPTAQYNVRIERVHSGSTSPSSDLQNNRSVSVYAWVPMEDRRLVDKYMESLPEGDRPIVGTQGEINRKRRLAEQVPLFDFNVENDKVADLKERDTLNRFVDNVRRNVVGVGEVVEVDNNAIIDNAMRGLDIGDGRSHVHIDANGRKTIMPTDCQLCAGHLRHGDVGVQTEHGPDGDTWHPSCFRCCECDQLLADMIYFYSKGKYYCGRHYAELQYPRCAGCDELIFAKEYTLAEDKPWHFDHFACYDCDLKLGGHRYITRDDQPHCLACYMRLFAKTCEGCQQKISAEEKRLNYGDLHWHADEKCFKCGTCSKALIGQKFYLKEKMLYCCAQCKDNRLNERR